MLLEVIFYFLRKQCMCAKNIPYKDRRFLLGINTQDQLLACLT